MLNAYLVLSGVERRTVNTEFGRTLNGFHRKTQASDGGLDQAPPRASKSGTLTQRLVHRV